MTRQNPSPGRLVRDARDQRGWTQFTLAQRVGVKERTISRIENDQSHGQHTLQKIAEILELPPQQLGVGTTPRRTDALKEVLAALQRLEAQVARIEATLAELAGGATISSEDLEDVVRRAATAVDAAVPASPGAVPEATEAASRRRRATD